MKQDVDIAVVGAGPYGLAAATQLTKAGFAVRVFGEPLQFWREQTPRGMLLRSPYEGSNIGENRGPLTLQAFEVDQHRPLSRPVAASDFIDYGLWYQERVVPDLDRRDVRRVEQVPGGFRVVADDGEPIAAGRVVVAAGVGTFGWRPPQFASLAPSRASHTLDHADLAKFAGCRVTVVGGGQSALESAALLHEAGSDVDVLVRAGSVVWLHMRPWLHRQWPVSRMLYAAPDVGPAGISHLVARPRLYRSMPRRAQDRLGPRVIRPAGARWLISRLEHVPIRAGVEVTDAAPAGQGVRLSLTDGTERTVDHVLLATGYCVDLSQYAFLAPVLLARVATTNGWPRLSKGFETSVPGLHVLGAPAAWSHGPLMRFVAGSGFAARSLARGLRG
jgi:cation diffusion facilitator CzcD-associated flavoprotein CzcO